MSKSFTTWCSLHWPESCWPQKWCSNGPGPKIQSKCLSWITLNIQNMPLPCLLCSKGFEIPVLVFSEKPPPSKIFRDLWNKVTVIPVFWNYYSTARQKNVGTLQDFQSKFIEFLGFFRWPQSHTISSNLYSVWNISVTIWIINRTKNTFHFLAPKICTLRLDSFSEITKISTYTTCFLSLF